jgi:hypothetical protein
MIDVNTTPPPHPTHTPPTPGSDPALLLNLGLLHGWLGDSASAAARFTQLLEMPDLPATRRAEAFNHRSVTSLL